MRCENKTYKLPFCVDVKIIHKDGGIFNKEADECVFDCTWEEIIKIQTFINQKNDFSKIESLAPKPEYTWPAKIELYPNKDTTMIVSCCVVEVGGVTHEEMKLLEKRREQNLIKLNSKNPPSLLNSQMGEIFGRGICPRCLRDCRDTVKKDIRVERNMGSLQKISYYYCPDCEEIIDRASMIDKLRFG